MVHRSFQQECTKQPKKADYQYVNQNIFEGLNKRPRLMNSSIKQEPNRTSDSKEKPKLLHVLESFKSYQTLIY